MDETSSDWLAEVGLPGKHGIGDRFHHAVLAWKGCLPCVVVSGGGGATGYKRPLAGFRAASMARRGDARARARSSVAVRTTAKLAERKGNVIRSEITEKINNLCALLQSHCG